MTTPRAARLLYGRGDQLLLGTDEEWKPVPRGRFWSPDPPWLRGRTVASSPPGPALL